jgi:integrase
MSVAAQEGRQRGRIEQRGNALRVSVYGGVDPVTGRRVYLRETIQGTDRAAERRARSAMARLIAQVDSQRSPQSSATLAHALAEFMRVSELEHTTRDSYEGFIRRLIGPALGQVAVAKLSAQHLEKLYAELRRCRLRCDRQPFVEHHTDQPHDCQQTRHRKRRLHDCQAAGCRTIVRCRPHQCRPMSASSIRQIHSILSGTLSLAERWGWIGANPARAAKRPKQKTPEPHPPSPAEAARLIDEAFAMDADWGTLVWLIMTTGIRRGEACALRFADLAIDTDDEGMVEIRRNYVRRAGLDLLKDPKTHQIRRIALDTETVSLLREHRTRVQTRLADLHAPYSPELFVFTGTRTPDHTAPCPPDSVTHRYKAMADRLGITTHIHALRHYSATELLTAGVDLRTVAGRLGHGGGGATTLRVYAAWVEASDRKAAEILASRMPRRATRRAENPSPQ